MLKGNMLKGNMLKGSDAACTRTQQASSKGNKDTVSVAYHLHLPSLDLRTFLLLSRYSLAPNV